jgi:hypothetical protein
MISGPKTGRISVKRQRRVTPENRGKTGAKRKPPIGRRFQKGQSGNPGGRPRKLRLTDAARSWLEQVDEKTGLTNAMLCVSALGRKALKGSHEAFRVLGDRAEGKPQQTVELNTDKHDDVKELVEAMNKRYTDEQEAKEKKDKK